MWQDSIRLVKIRLLFSVILRLHFSLQGTFVDIKTHLDLEVQMQKMKLKQKELESRVKKLENENKHLLRENGDLKKMKGVLNNNVKHYDRL